MAKGRVRKSTELIKEEVTMELTPMIDVVFLILIFFMLTLKFKVLEGKLVSYLPTDQGLSNAQPEVPKEDAEIRLRCPSEDWNKKNPFDRRVQFMRGTTNFMFGEASGVRFGDDNRVEFMNVSPPDTFEKISEYLRTIKEADPTAKAKINAWPQVAHAYVVKVLNLMMAEDYQGITYSGIAADLMGRLQKQNWKGPK